MAAIRNSGFPPCPVISRYSLFLYLQRRRDFLNSDSERGDRTTMGQPPIVSVEIEPEPESGSLGERLERAIAHAALNQPMNEFARERIRNAVYCVIEGWVGEHGGHIPPRPVVLMAPSRNFATVVDRPMNHAEALALWRSLQAEKFFPSDDIPGQLGRECPHIDWDFVSRNGK
jgi:hypothetical protein